MLTLVSPSVAGDADYRAWWDDAGRRGASPAVAAALITALARADLRSLLPAIRVPVLVIVRRGCPSYDPEHGRYLAAHLPIAALIEYDDVDDPWWLGDTARVVAAFDEHARPV